VSGAGTLTVKESAQHARDEPTARLRRDCALRDLTAEVACRWLGAKGQMSNGWGGSTALGTARCGQIWSELVADVPMKWSPNCTGCCGRIGAACARHTAEVDPAPIRSRAIRTGLPAPGLTLSAGVLSLV